MARAPSGAWELETFCLWSFQESNFPFHPSFPPLLKHTPPSQHHPHFTNFAINGSHQGLSLLSLNIILRLLLIFVIVVVVAHYVANRPQIDWRWISFHATFTLLSQLTIFMFLLSIQVKRLVNNSQPRLPGRPLRYVFPSLSSPSSPSTTNFFLPFSLLDCHWRSQEASQIPSWYRRSPWD